MGEAENDARAQTVIFSEDFEDLTLQDSFSSSETIRSNVWTDVPPTGWSIDNSQMVGDPVPEFNGWVFLDKQWWIDTAGNQNRVLFTYGIGNVAVADPDEADDGAGISSFNSLIFSNSFSWVGRVPED